MKARLVLCLFTLVNLTLSQAQSDLLQSGPMLGYSEMREVMLWVQTSRPAQVQVAYWPAEEKNKRMLTDKVSTQESEAFTAHLVADQLEPGIQYTYELLINDKAVKLDYPTTFRSQELWQWRKDAPDFSVAIGSCAYINEEPYDRPGRPYGGEYEVFNQIYQAKPDAMIWLGDNIYLREVDWFTRTGIHKRYTHSRSIPELQPLLASTNHYAIWDDHDFGPNDSDRSFIHKDKTLEAFKLFWGNPSYGLPNQEGGITSYFQYNDVDFFLLDNRYFRSPNRRETGEKTILGKEQLEWLVDALCFSNAAYKVVCIGGQVLNTAAAYENYANHHHEERAYLLQQIEENNIKNVIFLSGDRHHSELSKLVNAKGNTVYDFTASPLTSGVSTNSEEQNALRVANTWAGAHSFGLMEFSGPRDARKLKMTLRNAQGETLWAHEITRE
ncbi:MAG TPA: alkaline phosphatase D family protein [Saprospiraceae bacterium]|nr:alkaline phosphatase D family protein [Saprospiraceae bacterium]HMQ84273.1 alkaline phosphatase D family protein [Saprospiraceae bacterium]